MGKKMVMLAACGVLPVLALLVYGTTTRNDALMGLACCGVVAVGVVSVVGRVIQD